MLFLVASQGLPCISRIKAETLKKKNKTRIKISI